MHKKGKNARKTDVFCYFSLIFLRFMRFFQPDMFRFLFRRELSSYSRRWRRFCRPCNISRIFRSLLRSQF